MDVGVGVGVGLGPPCAQYLPPVFKLVDTRRPPHTIISVPVQTAVWESRPSGASVVVVAVQLLAMGSYLLPVSNSPKLLLLPPQMIISAPVHTAV